MTDGVKTALIVGGVAVGAFVLLRVLSPAPALAAGGPSSAISINGITSAIGALAGLAGGLFGGGAGRPTSGAPSVGYESGESFDDFYTGMFGPGSLDVAG